MRDRLQRLDWGQAVEDVCPLVFLDCCHAGGMATAKVGAQDVVSLPPGLTPTAPPKGVTEVLKQGAGRVVFCSSTGRQASYVRPDGRLSLYTYHLLEALQGAANRPGDTVVRVSHLMNHLGRAMPESARALGVEQTPFFDAATEDFPVALLREGKGLPAGGWATARAEAAGHIERIVQAIGNRSVAIGGSVSGSTIITGDRNVVQQGKYNVQIGRTSGLAIGDGARVESDDSS